ncbi:adenylate/guanylate cyclase domain-containing protein [Bombella saccharophila]|uniref:Cache domain-containing protein n=1 Tax=Bombella saccharophila TaxID=2967338 RepID=A0ABT3W5Z7_9PROT|nr:cache domain-containing protein [Bombella saccharophila]MCX5614198.1 cache domain-containing protein [Bombella saccharophila]
MLTDEIVDPAIDTTGRRWQLFQFIGPILGVILVIVTIALVTLYTYRTMREGAITLSRNLLRSQQRYITEEVSHYLSPATGISFMASNMLTGDDIKQNAATFMTLGRSVLRDMPHVDSFYLADDQGHFWMASRRDNAYEETTMQIEDGAPYYRHKVTDKDGRFISTDRFSAEGYDPRLRLWYKKAVERESRTPDRRLFWTAPYLHLSTRQFIVTASLAFQALDGHKIVFAINISLNQLTKFVNSLKVGKSGQAVIVDLDGHVIAGHNMADIGKPGFDAANVSLDPKTQPVFVRALDVFRVMGDGSGIVHARGTSYVTIAAAMPLAKRSWVLLLNAPEGDFANFTQVVKHQTVYFSVIIVGLALVLAAGLIYQGRRVERLQKELGTFGEEKKEDNIILLKIINTVGLLNPKQEQPYLCEALSERSVSRRASIWRLLSDGDRLLCEDMFDRDRNAHRLGMELTRTGHPGLFECLEGGHPVDVPNAEEDPRLQSVQRVVMRMIDTHHLFLLPVMEEHRLVGAIMLEDPIQLTEAERVVMLIASVLAVRFGQVQEEEGNKEDSVRTSTTPSPSASRSARPQLRVIEGFLLRSNTDSSNPTNMPEPGLYPSVPIMVLEFSEAYSSNHDAARAMLDLVGELTDKIQSIAREHNLFSVQVAGNRFIFLGSCSQTLDSEGAANLADAAIGIREVCLMIISHMNTRLMFRIGIDVGAVLVAHLGKNRDVFNLWGEGLTMAGALAHNAPDGGQIQVSDRAYQILQGLFLFRLRGEFFLPGSGIANSYILAGKGDVGMVVKK